MSSHSLVSGSTSCNRPWRNHPQVRPRQSSSSILTIVFGICVTAALVLDLYGRNHIDLEGVLPIPYTPLLALPDSFRILIILPGSGSQPIRCQLDSTRLSEISSYDALSYRWGDVEDVKPIFVNGVKVAVTKNLWLALSSLRDAREPRSLWADAICINQCDNSELSAQVPIMASIYNRAKSVIIYLGDHQPRNNLHEQSSLDEMQSSAVTQALKSLDRADQRTETSQNKYDLAVRGDEDPVQELLHDKVQTAIRKNKVAVLAMDYFLRNMIHEEYWRRGWIIQEIVMASSSLVIRHGNTSTEWDEFMRWIARYHQRHPRDRNVQQIMHLDNMRQRRLRTGSVFTLAFLMDAFNESFTTASKKSPSPTVFHDKVYSLIGLAHDWPSGKIPIDYERSAAQVYQDCMTYFWKYSGMAPKQRSIELVYFSSLVRKSLTRESDVRRKPPRPFGEHPHEAEFDLVTQDLVKQTDQQGRDLNFTEALVAGLAQGVLYGILAGIYLGISGFHNTGQERFWKAHKAENLALWVLDHDNAKDFTDMCVRGMRVDEIQQIGPAYTTVDFAITEETVKSKTITNPPTDSAQSALKKDALAEIKSLLRSLNPSTTQAIAHLLCPKQAYKALEALLQTGKVPELHQEHHPRIFLGTNGSAGLVSSEAQPGDLVIRFWNLDTIAIVRKEQPKSSLKNGIKDEYRLIGRAVMVNSRQPNTDVDVSSRLNGEFFGVANEEAIDVPVTLRQLTHLSLNASYRL